MLKEEIAEVVAHHEKKAHNKNINEKQTREKLKHAGYFSEEGLKGLAVEALFFFNDSLPGCLMLWPLPRNLFVHSADLSYHISYDGIG